MQFENRERIVDFIVPVLNEEAQLSASVRRLVAELASIPFLHGLFRVVIADNGSTDGTSRVATDLIDELPEVHYLRIAEKGRGRALRLAWGFSTASVLAYTDVDLSTDLCHLPALLMPVLSNEVDIVCGSRLAADSVVERGIKREVLSRAYNWLAGALLNTRVCDLQCGFKAVRREAFDYLQPLISSDGWFFDTELLVLAEALGFRIRQIPVHWRDDTDSRVNIISTVLEDLKGLARLRRRLTSRNFVIAETVVLKPPAIADKD